jgi:hypothetical protein
VTEGQNTEETREAFEAREVESDKTEYIEFVGDAPHGTEFHASHSITSKHMKDYHDVDLGKKEVVWARGTNGRFLVPVADITPEAAEILVADPMFRRVKL